MQYHKWNPKEISLLKKNIERYGLTAGCKKTSETLKITQDSCYQKCIKENIRNYAYSSYYNPDFEEKLAKYLRKEIARNPNNLTEAFKNTAEKFGFKTMHPIMNRWYGYKRKLNGKVITDFSQYPSCRKNIGVVYTVIGSNATVNGKNQNVLNKRKTGWIMSIVRMIFKIKR